MRSLSEPMRQALERMAASMSVSLPGRVESYDAATQAADVKPLIKREYRDGAVEPMPVIPGVPVVWPRAGGAAMTMPVAAGDGVLLVFADRSIDAWLQEGGEVAPGDTRKHALSDAVAVPGLVSFADLGEAGPSPDPDAVVVWHGDTVMKLQDDGTIEVTGNIEADGDITATGNIEADGDISAGGDVVADKDATAISLLNHTHIGNLGSSTSPPEP